MLLSRRYLDGLYGCLTSFNAQIEIDVCFHSLLLQIFTLDKCKENIGDRKIKDSFDVRNRGEKCLCLLMFIFLFFTPITHVLNGV